MYSEGQTTGSWRTAPRLGGLRSVKQYWSIRHLRDRRKNGEVDQQSMLCAHNRIREVPEVLAMLGTRVSESGGHLPVPVAREPLRPAESA